MIFTYLLTIAEKEPIIWRCLE